MLLERKDFKIKCNPGIFNQEERTFLKTYGTWLEALAKKTISPFTVEQEHFVLSVNGSSSPRIEHEKLWWRYQKRCELEVNGEYGKAY